MRLRANCPQCAAKVVVPLTTGDVSCPACSVRLEPNSIVDGKLTHCACCGCTELYRQKDFPQWLGMMLLTVACVVFYLFAIRYQYAIAWTVLLGSAALDGLVYLIVGDVVICYRCAAQHRGIPSRTFDPFDLSIAEKYRQERLRREQLEANKPL